MQGWLARSDAVHHATMPEIRVQPSVLVWSLRGGRAGLKNNVFQCLQGASQSSSSPSGRLTLLWSYREKEKDFVVLRAGETRNVASPGTKFQIMLMHSLSPSWGGKREFESEIELSMTRSAPFNGKLLLVLFMRDTFLTNTTKINTTEARGKKKELKKKTKILKYKPILYLIRGWWRGQMHFHERHHTEGKISPLSYF